jgi:hypothetical protein
MEDLQYVTEHFNDLRGLLTAPLWAGMLVAAALCQGESSKRHMLLLCVSAVVPSAIWIPWIWHWYKRHYGAVAGRPIELGRGFFWVSMLVIGLNIGIPVFSKGSHLSTAGGLLPYLAFAILPKCFYTTPESSPIRLRRAFYIAGSIFILATTLGAFFGHLSRWIYLYVDLWSLLFLNLYDHWLLNHLLRSRIVEPAHG